MVRESLDESIQKKAHVMTMSDRQPPNHPDITIPTHRHNLIAGKTLLGQFRF